MKAPYLTILLCAVVYSCTSASSPDPSLTGVADSSQGTEETDVRDDLTTPPELPPVDVGDFPVSLPDGCTPDAWFEYSGSCHQCNAAGTGAVGEGQRIIDDGDPCTAQECNPDTGFGYVPLSDVPCDDADPDTTLDECHAGTCLGIPVICQPGTWEPEDEWWCRQCSADGTGWDGGDDIGDFNQCTIDVCDPDDGVQHLPADGMACADGDDCTAGDACVGDLCVGTPLDCDDSNPCTADTCEPDTGCHHTNIDGPCDDGNPETAQDHCDAGACWGYAVICEPEKWDAASQWWCRQCNEFGTDYAGGEDIDDLNPCTQDACDPDQGALHVATDGATCWDEDACTTNEVCAGSVCTGAPLDCADFSPCTQDACAPDAGCVFTLTQGACDDLIPATADDQCVQGVCIGMLDPDGDGIPNHGEGPECAGPDLLVDCVDNCPYRANTDQVDSNADGAGDACGQPRWWSRIDTNEKVVALTFNGVWSDEAVRGLLSILHEKGARASFFLVGQNLDKNYVTPATMMLALSGGHLIANATYSFDLGDDFAQTVAQIDQARTVFLDAVGQPLAPLFRPPGGDIVAWLNDALAQTGFTEGVLGTFDSYDYAVPPPTPAALAECIIALAEPGDIIQFQAGPEVTVAAMPAIIDGLHANGFALLNLEQILAYGPPVYSPEFPDRSCQSWFTAP